MEQQTLRQWESRCTQEEMAYCQAACPLHVDARAFLGLLAKGDVNGARKVLERTMPLPGVLGRLCEAPCEAACKRREVGPASSGETLAVGLLERYALAVGKPGPRPLRLPGKGLKAVVLGRGLAALTCAWDLLKKGYGVTLVTLGLPVGGALAALPETLLPAAALEAELAVLKALGLVLDQAPGEGRAVLARALGQGGAVFLEWGFSPATDADFPARAAVDPVTLAAAPLAVDAPANLYVGGWPDETGRVRHIDAAADGRRAASSLDRHLSGASLTASREREGVLQTRLFTSLAGVLPAPRIAPAAADYTPAEATAEAARCLQCQCLECVRVCAYLEKHKAYPKVYARQIYNNAAIVRGQHLANTLINSCSLCGLCAKVCPEGFAMAELCLTARRDMAQRGVMPQSAHEFALEDMAQASGPDCALTRAAPAVAGEPNGSTLAVFFPGCQLAASHPHHVESVYTHLRAHLRAHLGPENGGVGLMLRCCGVPAHWAGEEELFRASVSQFAAQWESLGRPRVIAACSSCLEAFRQPEFQAAMPGLVAVSLWEVLAELPLPEFPAGSKRPGGPLALHDPCTARDDPAFLRSVRALASRAGVEVEELPLSGALTECCGFGGLMGQVDAPLAREVAARRAAESPRDSLAACAMCRDRIFAAGKRCWHLLDLLFPGQEADPAARPGPGYSGRQEARASLKARLLQHVWGEPRAEDMPGQTPEIVLVMEPEVAARLEERRILLSDIRQTIAQAQATGRYLREETTGRLLAAHRPRRVTFWAEYAPGPEPGAYRLLNCYSHRMIVPGAGGVDAAALAQPGESAPVNRVDQTYAPESGVWRCAGCDAPLEPSPVVVSYLGSVFTISLFGCPLCGQTLVPEALALGRMAEVEQLLEDK